MTTLTATSQASPNIALIKYWGNQDNLLRIPANNSISLNLSELKTITKVEFDTNLEDDQLILNGEKSTGKALDRVRDFLNVVRQLAGKNILARVTSSTNFPISAGIASSAAAFAALAKAAASALALDLSEKDLSRLARRGSGSACRSIPDGFVEWFAGSKDEDSFAVSIAAPQHWAIADCVAILQTQHKTVGSSDGQTLAATSPLQNARVQDASRRLDLCRRAILERDFAKLASVIELDSNLMHAIMMTSTPPLFYWHPSSITVMQQIQNWRHAGLPVCYTMDAGPNVHVITLANSVREVTQKLQDIPGVHQVLCAHPGMGAQLITS